MIVSAMLLSPWLAPAEPAQATHSDAYITWYSTSYSRTYEVDCDWVYSFTGSNGHDYVASECTGVEICANEIGLEGSRDTDENRGTKTVTESYTVTSYTCHHITQVKQWLPCMDGWQYASSVDWTEESISSNSASLCANVATDRACDRQDM